MDIHDEGDAAKLVVFGLFLASGLSMYLLLTSIPTSSISSDIAGLGTFASTSTISGQCETIVATQRQFSTAPLSNPAWGASQFYTETDQLRYTYYSGQLNGVSCSGSIAASFVASSPPYPITPAMVVLACGSYPKTCAFYPPGILKFYSTAYPIGTVSQAGNVPLFSPSSLGIVAPNDILTWSVIST